MFAFSAMQGAGAAEWSVESDIESRVEYNDNIHLQVDSRESVSSFVIVPSIKMLAKEKNWETFIDSKLRSNHYSDKNLDSNDKYFDISGKYFSERDSFSLNGFYDLDSSLSTQSSDFGIVARRINRELWRIAPQYVRVITERLTLRLGYDHTEAKYIDAVNTGLEPYNADTTTGSFAYNLTEIDRLNLSIQATEYESDDKDTEYQIIVSKVGMSHKLSESFSIDYQVGGSRRDTISRSTDVFNFFGQPITLVPVAVRNNGFVLDAGFEKSWEVSSLSGRISRDNITDSFGGLSEVDKIRLEFKQNITSIWKYSIIAKHDVVESVSEGNGFSDRSLVYFEPIIYYSPDRDWKINASYRYIQREFKGSNSSGRAPYSNRVFVGIAYNFPSLSTF